MIADKSWNMLPDKGKAIMLAQREVASFVCDAVNLEGIPFTLAASHGERSEGW